MPNGENITDKDRDRAEKCVQCPICRRAREKQGGPAYWFVKMIEGSICPNGKAYTKVYGRKPHEPIPAEES